MRYRYRRLEPGVLYSVIIALVALAAIPAAGYWLTEPMARRSEPLPLSFPHSKHVNHSGCAVCHHNVTDNDMAGMPCIHCHQSDHPKLKRNIESEFHDFCKGCHAEQARWFKDKGPVRECKGCHVATSDGFMP